MIRRCIKLSLLAFLIASFGGREVCAQPYDQDVGLIYSLYKTYAWSALFTYQNGSQNYLGKRIEFEKASVLARFYEKSLAKLIVADRECVERTKEECALGFDILWGSQDPQVSDLRIYKKDGIVIVKYNYQTNNSVREIDYKVIRTGRDFFISDVVYLDGSEKHSLRDLLANWPGRNSAR